MRRCDCTRFGFRADGNVAKVLFPLLLAPFGHKMKCKYLMCAFVHGVQSFLASLQFFLYFFGLNSSCQKLGIGAMELQTIVGEVSYLMCAIQQLIELY